MLLLASSQAKIIDLPRPKWYTKLKTQRTTTQDLLNQFKAIKWTDSIKINFSDFVMMEKNNEVQKIILFIRFLVCFILEISQTREPRVQLGVIKAQIHQPRIGVELSTISFQAHEFSSFGFHQFRISSDGTRSENLIFYFLNKKKVE